MKALKNIYISWLAKWGIAFFIFSLCRFLFYFFNSSHFDTITLTNIWGGLRYDWMTISILYLPFLLALLLDYRSKYKITLILFHISNSLGIIFNCIDFEYFKFTFKRTTADIFITSGLENDLLNLIPTFILDYWHLILIGILLMGFSHFLYLKSTPQEIKWPGKWRYIFLYLIPVMGFYVLGFRGGLQYKPLNVIQASRYAEAKNIPLVLNTPFTIIKSANKPSIVQLVYFNDETELEEHFSPIVQLKPKHEFQYKNVVLLILESFSKEYIGALNPGEQTYTPFLDQLIQKSLVIEHTFANGKKSIEALPAILSGIPTLMNTAYISSKAASNRIESIGSKLKEKGYRTIFYHGGENGTMGFNSYTNMAGIDEYIGKNEYPYTGDYDGNWGIFDEPFLQFCIEDLSQGEQPFFASIFTLSSHHPYTVPKKYENNFQGGPLPILKSVEYADYALAQFFESARKMSWFDNTLFVLTADHTAHNYLESYNNRMGMYAVPLIFYAPKFIEAQRIEKVSQQADIYPSVLDFLGYEGKILSYGQSVLSDHKGFSINYINQIYQLIEDDFCLHFNGKESVGLYDWKKDLDLKNNLIDQEPYKKSQMELEQKLKAILQSYTQRLNRNQLMP